MTAHEPPQPRHCLSAAERSGLEHLRTAASTQCRGSDCLGKIPAVKLVDQRLKAVRDAPVAAPIGQKGDRIVMAAWLHIGRDAFGTVQSLGG
jgi:hypothetical protein